MRSKAVGDLINFFKDVIEGQKISCSFKQSMTSAKGFDAAGLFRKISNNQSYISINTMKEYVRKRVACNDRQLYDLFQKFDHKRCGFILIEDFKNEVKPYHTKGKGKNHVKSKTKKEHAIPFKIEQHFSKLISQIIRNTRVLDIWRKELDIFKPYIIFEEINQSKTGVISTRELFQFFYDNEQQLNKTDADILYLSLLRRCHRELNLEVFCENLKPLEFGYYPSFQHYFQKGVRDQLLFKERIAKEAVEVQENYLKEKRNQEIVDLIHQEAGLSRENELEKRVQDELRAYRQLKYLTTKKFHPHLTFEQFVIMEKQNVELGILREQVKEEQERLKDLVYRDKMRNIETLQEVQKFQDGKGTFSHAFSVGNAQKVKMSELELEKRIKNHTFSTLMADDLLMKRKVQKQLHPFQRML